MPGQSLTVSENEITDLVRVAALAGDGLAVPAGFGIWEAATNLCTNGGFETNTTGWNSGGRFTLARDTSKAKFGTASVKSTETLAGGATIEIASFRNLALTAGASYACSAWIWIPSTWTSGAISIRLFDFANAVDLAIANADMTKTDQWQRVSVSGIANAAVNQGLRIVAAGVGVLNDAVWIDGAHIELRRSAVTLTASGNEITDAVRAADALLGITASGNMCDGQTVPDSSFGIRRAATNLFRQGQCDSTSSIDNLSGGQTVSTDATVPAPFSTQSIKVVCDGSSAGTGIGPRSAAGLAAAVGTSGAVSMWFKGVLGNSYNTHSRWKNTDASITDGVTTTFTATGAWQLLTPASVAVAAGKTGDALQVTIQIASQRAETFWVAHAMLESGHAVVAPYVATSGGVTATHAAALVQAPSSLINATQGWVAARLRIGYPSTTIPNTLPRLFQWQDAGATNFIRAMLNASTRQWQIDRSGGANSAFSAAQTFSAGDFVTVIVAWTATQVMISINGGNFVTAANAGTPTGLPATINIADNVLSGGRSIDSDYMWLVSGTGTLTNADATALNALGNTDPNVDTTLGSTAGVTAMWSADTAAYVTPGATTQIATPYVHTDGSTQTRNAARVQAPSSLLNATQGWVAMRVRPGWDSSTNPASPNNSPYLFAWNDGTANNRIELSLSGAGQFRIIRGSGGVVGQKATGAQVWAAGQAITLVMAWTATQIAISFNGGAFQTLADTHIPAGLGAGLDIGTTPLTAEGVTSFDGDVLWLACGTGTLTNADAAALAALADHDPSFANLPVSAQLKAVMPFDTAVYEIPVSLDSAPVLSYA